MAATAALIVGLCVLALLVMAGAALLDMVMDDDGDDE